MINISNIGASLQYGKFITGKWLGVLYLCLILCFSLPILAIVLIIIQVVSGLPWNSNSFINAFAIGSILFLLVSIYFLYVIIKNNKLKKNINIWLEDAVELKAISNTIDSYKEYISIGAYNMKKIKVIFELNGKKITKTSGLPNYNKNKYNTKAGFDSIFRKYADRAISILYSSKHEQVLILKD